MLPQQPTLHAVHATLRAPPRQGSASQAASKFSILTEKTKVGKAGLVIGIAIAWGMYAYGVLGEGKDAGRSTIVGAASAMTVFVILMFIISAIPIVGAAVQLFFMIFDGLAMLICGITGSPAGFVVAFGFDHRCAGRAFLRCDMFVDMEDSNRLRITMCAPRSSTSRWEWSMAIHYA